jgi:ribosomal protein S18 acetylase RimI-like enzyme
MVLVRQAYPSDAQAIARIHVETWRTTYAGLLPDRMLAEMNEHNHKTNWTNLLARDRDEFVLVAERPKVGVVGFASGGPARRALEPYSGEIFTLYVTPDCQNQGVGTALLSAAFKHLAEQSMKAVMLWVLARNPSRFFYEAMGGMKAAARKERLWGSVQPEIAYGWPDATRALSRSSNGARAG